MTKTRNLEVSTAPSFKNRKSIVQKKPLLRVIKKKAAQPKFLLGLKRFLVQRNRTVKIHKRKSGGIGTVSSANKSRLSASSEGNEKRLSLVESPPLLPIQASIGDIRTAMSPAKSPPVLPIQASIGDKRTAKSPAKSPPVLPIQASSECIRRHESPDKSPPVLVIQNELNSPKSMSGESDVETSEELNSVGKSELTRPMAPVKGKMKILRESNAVSPATVMLAPSLTSNVRVGFDRNLEPQKIVKMAEYRGKDYFIMKWKGSEIMDIVPTEIAKQRCPQVVIQFYEKHLTNVHNRAMDSYE